jgi:CHAT domain-containing protein/tetratricopeptide (TPR) repeat protein
MRNMGDYAAARQYFERALRTKEQGVGPDHPSLASYINNLASLLAESGDVAAARPLFEQALAIRARALGPEHRDVGTSTHNLANVLLQTGDYAAAKPLFERALVILEKALGPEHPGVASCLDNLANLCTREGSLTTARELHTRSLAIKEKALGAEHPSVGVTLDALAEGLLAEGRLVEARALYERALAIKEKAQGPEHPEVARSLDNLGSVLHESGEYARALSLHERALELRLRALGPQHPDVALSHRNCAVGRLAKGDAEGAFASALEAERVGNDHLRLTSRSLGERETLRYAAARYGGLDLALTLLGDPRLSTSPGAAARAWDSVVHSRAAVLDEMAARHRAAFEIGDPGIDSLAATERAARMDLANLTVRGVGEDSPEEYRRQLEAATRAKEAAERRLAESSAEFQAQEVRARLGLADVMQALPRTAVLLAYTRFTPPRLPATAQGGGVQLGEAAYVVFVGRRLESDRNQVEAVPLWDAAAIDSLANEWRREAGTYAWGDDASGHESACRRVGEALRRRIWDPIAPRVAGADLVLVVPDGPLHLVNLAALPTGETGYLVEEYLLHVLSAERDVVRPPVRSGQGLLAVGDPDYDRTEGGSASVASYLLSGLTPFRGARPGCAAFERLEFVRLPSTRREVGDLDRLWKRVHRREPVVELTGRRAGEARVKAEMPGKRVIHLATHGFFLGDECPTTANGATVRAASSTSPSETPLATASLENPLLLSGLALAGSNLRQRAAPDVEDGVLTAEEVASLDLRGVEWAVLSACETAAGDVHAGEGVFGLRRAFETAGVHTLIMSLWSVEDEAGRAWMEALYSARFTDGLSTAIAVRAAHRSTLSRLRTKQLTTHPSLWAGFIAAGDWR